MKACKAQNTIPRKKYKPHETQSHIGSGGTLI